MHLLQFLTICSFIFASSVTHVVSQSRDWMGVESGATFCKGLKEIQNNGFDPRSKMTPISMLAAASAQDTRPRWSASVPEFHGSLSILLANRDGRGNLQHHVKIHYYARNWVGYMVIKASYQAAKDGPLVDHCFAYDLEYSAGCVLTTQSAYRLYNVAWSYQLTGHLMRPTS